MSTPDAKRLLAAKEAVTRSFTLEHWLELGALTGSLDIVRGHDRLLRSLQWSDQDYPGAVLAVLIAISERASPNFDTIEHYIEEKFGEPGVLVSSQPVSGRKIIFAPNAFEIPDAAPDPMLVSVMMPFSGDFNAAYKAISETCATLNLKCQRADNIWESSTVIQDIFSLIYRSFIVVCDFTGRNPNVFYETGIAHTLGKHVVPLTQSVGDVPFDLSHHRHLRYLNNFEGLTKLRQELTTRLRYLTGLPEPLYAVGARVTHHKFGEGTVAAVDGNKITIDFDKVGRKRIIDVFLGPTRRQPARSA